MLLERRRRPIRGVRIVHKSPTPGDLDPIRAQIIPYRRLEDAEVERVLTMLATSDDVTSGQIVTSALATSEQEAFRNAGFVDREALHLLRHRLIDIPTQREPQHRTRPGRRSDLGAILSIDHDSFDSFWTFDRESLNAARKATPTNRYRVALVDGIVAGYAISGRAGRASFLQRLGVAPVHRGKGIGTQLVKDALDWAKAEGATSMLVNTQTTNVNALRLYESLDFVLSSDQLTVLQLTQ